LFKQLLRTFAGWTLLFGLPRMPQRPLVRALRANTCWQTRAATAWEAYDRCGQCPHRWSSGTRRAFAWIGSAQ